MKQIQVMLTSIEEVKNFVSLTNKYPFPIQMTTEKYKIDAKSIMGVFSLDLSKPITVNAHTDGDAHTDAGTYRNTQGKTDRGSRKADDAGQGRGAAPV